MWNQKSHFTVIGNIQSFDGETCGLLRSARKLGVDGRSLLVREESIGSQRVDCYESNDEYFVQCFHFIFGSR